MSCIVGIVNKKGVWIGSDNLATTEDGAKRPIIVPKIFRNGNYLIGTAGSLRSAQLVHPHYFKPPRNIMDFVSKLIELFEEHGVLGRNGDGELLHATNFIIGYRKRLYEILVDFQMSEVPEYTAIGSGSYYAFGSLFESATNPDLDPPGRIRRALEAAEAFDRSTGRPFFVEKL